MTIDLSGLNDNQRRAVEWDEGPVLVLAGPGSGKTRVLTLRVARLLAESAGDRFRILAVTFTNKAASEMRTRVDGLIEEGRDRATLTTFHSLAVDILRQHGSHVGIDPDFAILSDQADREAALADAVAACRGELEEPPSKPSQLLPVITRLLDECVHPDEVEGLLEGQRHASDVATVYRSYRSVLLQSNTLDFATLLALCIELLEKRPAVAKQVRRVYEYVCVDEFQDTNQAQFRLLTSIVADDSPNLFVVADDDQIIYQWNGADPARLTELHKRYEMATIQLPENYRCPPQVISLANKLIAHNTDRAADKQPLAANKVAATGDAVRTPDAFGSFAEEAAWIAKDLASLPSEERGRTAVLARRKKLLETVVEACEAAEVDSYIAIRKNEFQSAPYRWLHATLRLANAPQEREQLRRMSRAFFVLEGIQIEDEDVVAGAAVESEGLLRTWLSLVQQRDSLSQPAQVVLTALKNRLIARLDYMGFVNAAKVWFQTLADDPSVPEASSDEAKDEADIWEALLSDIRQHHSLSDLALHEFLQELDLRAKEKPVPQNAVRCLTIHAAKGLEFSRVYVIGMVDEELPSWASLKKGGNSNEVREERRNCFVAITRAEDVLTLTHAKRYQGYAKRPSRFLKEMGLL